MSTKQKVLVSLIVITAALLLVAFFVRSDTSSLNKQACLDRGRVWDQRQNRCLDNQAQLYPQSFAINCKGVKAATLVLMQEGQGYFVRPAANPAVVSVSKESAEQWDYSSNEGSVRVSLSGRTATLQTTEGTTRDCRINSRAPVVLNNYQLATIGQNQTAQINNVTITLKKIIRDSRCPIDIACVQEGGITVRLKLFSQGLLREVNLSSEGQPYQFGNHVIQVAHTAPPRLSSIEIKKPQYKITFAVSSTTATST